MNRGEEQLLVLSPGDLDEAVIAFLLTSDSSAEVEDAARSPPAPRSSASTPTGTASSPASTACDAIRAGEG